MEMVLTIYGLFFVTLKILAIILLNFQSFWSGSLQKINYTNDWDGKEEEIPYQPAPITMFLQHSKLRFQSKGT